MARVHIGEPLVMLRVESEPADGAVLTAQVLLDFAAALATQPVPADTPVQALTVGADEDSLITLWVEVQVPATHLTPAAEPAPAQLPASGDEQPPAEPELDQAADEQPVDQGPLCTCGHRAAWHRSVVDKQRHGCDGCDCPRSIDRVRKLAEKF